jgi:hypothetical protein
MKVEESVSHVPESAWFKSSYSSGEGGQCVEVADCPGTVRVRDSKDKKGPVLFFASGRWADFIEFAVQD